MTIASALSALRDDLGELGADFAVVGGLAVSAVAIPRFTRDVDVAVVVSSDAAAEALVRVLTSTGWTLTALVEQVVTGRLAQARMQPPGPDPVTCDLLFASSEIEAEVVAAAIPLEVLPGIVVPVASRGYLIAMKLLSVDDRRLQDRLDLESLVEGADRLDRSQATVAVTAIMDAGANRARDLRRMLSELRWPPGSEVGPES